jgi:hypothetical protein
LKHFILEKSKRIWVPPSGRKKGYWRQDPREKKGLLGLLIDIFDNIRGLKKQGKFTKKQRRLIKNKLKELEPKFKHFKTQKQRMAVAKALKDIRLELEEKTTPEARAKDGKVVPEELREGLKRLGYSVKDLGKMSSHAIRTVYYNEIPK